MSTAIDMAALSLRLDIAALDRKPRDRWARDRREFALRALEALQAEEIAAKQNGAGMPPSAA